MSDRQETARGSAAPESPTARNSAASPPPPGCCCVSPVPPATPRLAARCPTRRAFLSRLAPTHCPSAPLTRERMRNRFPTAGQSPPRRRRARRRRASRPSEPRRPPQPADHRSLPPSPAPVPHRSGGRSGSAARPRRRAPRRPPATRRSNRGPRQSRPVRVFPTPGGIPRTTRRPTRPALPPAPRRATGAIASGSSGLAGGGGFHQAARKSARCGPRRPVGGSAPRLRRGDRPPPIPSPSGDGKPPAHHSNRAARQPPPGGRGSARSPPSTPRTTRCEASIGRGSSRSPPASGAGSRPLRPDARRSTGPRRGGPTPADRWHRPPAGDRSR